MWEKNKRFLPLLLLTFLLLSLGLNTEARQGCCSHHGGVCGCRCCDGTSLSATCAPYYPQCNQPVQKDIPSIKTEVKTPELQEEIKPPKVEEQTPKNNSPISPYDYQKNLTAEIPKESNDGFSWIWIIIIAFIGYIFYNILKKKKNG